MGTTDRPFTNWCGSVVGPPVEWVRPASESEVVAVVERAAATGRRVKVVGAGHSFNALAAPDDLAVSLDALRGVRVAERAPDGTVTAVAVLGGTRLRDLNRALAARGLALPILGSIAAQSIAGAVATATHGSSLVHGNLSSLVRGMRLVTGSGDVLGLAREDPRLDGARVHLGALGVVTEVTLAVEPSFTLDRTTERVPVGEVSARLPEIARSAEYVKVWWLPHTRDALVVRHARTGERVGRHSRAALERWVDEHLMHRRVLPPVFALHDRRPGLVPAWNRVAGGTLVTGRRVGPSPLMFATPMPVRHDETEAAVALDRGGEAWDRAVRLVASGGLSVNFITELRFVRRDDGWMSPAQGRDVVQLGAYTGVRPHRDRYFDAFWEALDDLAPRPHWGKAMPARPDPVATAYPLAGRYAALRDELDPDRLFTNDFLRRTLGS